VSDHGPRRHRAQPFATAGGPTSWRRFLAVLLVLPFLGWFTLLPTPALALSDAQQLVVEAWRLVNQSFVDPERLEAVHWRTLRQKALEKPITRSDQAYDAIEAMLEPLGDPYTRLLRPQDYATVRSSTRGMVCGVGLQLGLRSGDQRIVVIAPLDGSPAAEAGIASGSEVLNVNGRSTQDLGLEGTAALLRGPSGSDVVVELREPRGQVREVVLRRRQVDLQPVRHKRLRAGSRSFGYLRITQFSEPVPQQVRDALEDLTAQPIDGLILDLRNNSGGLVSAGLAVANVLLDGLPIVETEDRDGLGALQQATQGTLYAGPMLTLVNRGTASASEILAGALQDGGRSPLAGSRTFGKGLIQTLISLGDGSGLAVTVAHYLTPGGRDIQDQGIQPEHLLPQPEPLNPGGAGDGWLDEAARLLATLAPAGQPAVGRATPAAQGGGDAKAVTVVARRDNG
jgi:carboxyl-terminal processing protease